MPKSAEAYFYEFQTSAETDTAMSLLRSKEVFLYLALMATHLADGQIVDGHRARPSSRGPAMPTIAA